jgi:hypothetical protein
MALALTATCCTSVIRVLFEEQISFGAEAKSGPGRDDLKWIGLAPLMMRLRRRRAMVFGGDATRRGSDAGLCDHSCCASDSCMRHVTCADVDGDQLHDVVQFAGGELSD